MERSDLEAWIGRYEQLWRTPGTSGLGELFTADVLYRAAPDEDTVGGCDALERFWDQHREGPDEPFTLRYEVVAADGDVGVVRARVDYGNGDSWLDVWIIRFAPDGRCEFFEEWPIAAPKPK